jgi:hypothetical protein
MPEKIFAKQSGVKLRELLKNLAVSNLGALLRGLESPGGGPKSSPSNPRARGPAGNAAPAANEDRRSIVRRLLAWLTGNKLPSADLDMSAAKACKILEDGEANGKPLTDAQKKMFGAKCGEKDKKVGNAAVAAALTTNRNTLEDTPMPSHSDKIAYLTTNCKCWEGKEAVLEDMSEDDVSEFYEAARRSEENEAVVNAVREVRPGLTVNAMPAFLKKMRKGAEDDEDEEDEEEREKMDFAPKKTRRARKSLAGITDKSKRIHNEEDDPLGDDRRPRTLDEVLDSTPDGKHWREVLNSAKQVDLERRQQLVRRLVANIDDEDRRRAKAKKLIGLSVPELEDLIDLLPKGDTRNRRGDESDADLAGVFNYSGAAGGPVIRLTENEQADVLDLEAARRSYDAKTG